MDQSLIHLEHSLNNVHSTFDEKHITWESTTVCNYDCSYCWPDSHNNKYRWPDAEQTDKLISYVKNFSDGKRVVFDIMGGEPTLWPDLERFCHAVGDYSLITFSTNGSRTARWWENFSAPVNHLLFSFHAEHADIEHYVEVLKAIHNRYRITVLILYHTGYREKCLAAWDRFTQCDLNIQVQFKRINTTPDRMTYTEEDKQILQRSYHNCNIKLVNVSTQFYVDNVLTNPKDLIIHEQNKFAGWSCNLGENYRYIKANGDIYGAACIVAPCVGNVYTTGEVKAMPSIICTTHTCECEVDIVLNSKQCYTQE